MSSLLQRGNPGAMPAGMTFRHLGRHAASASSQASTLSSWVTFTMDSSRRRFYGIAEIADALGIDRQLVTVWRRRSSHGMPAPDEELSSGPLWTAETIEPWITATRERLAAGTRTGAPDPARVRQAVRRLFRLVALLLEDEPRPDVIKRALDDLGRSHAALSPGDGRRGMPELLELTRRAAERPAEPDALLAEC